MIENIIIGVVVPFLVQLVPQEKVSGVARKIVAILFTGAPSFIATATAPNSDQNSIYMLVAFGVMTATYWLVHDLPFFKAIEKFVAEEGPKVIAEAKKIERGAETVVDDIEEVVKQVEQAKEDSEKILGEVDTGAEGDESATLDSLAKKYLK